MLTREPRQLTFLHEALDVFVAVHDEMRKTVDEGALLELADLSGGDGSLGGFCAPGWSPCARPGQWGLFQNGLCSAQQVVRWVSVRARAVRSGRCGQCKTIRAALVAPNKPSSG